MTHLGRIKGDISRNQFSMATRYMILKNGDRPTKSIVSRVLLIIEL